MKFIFWIVLFFTFIGFISIQFATVIDDPEHLLEPDPDCPICLAAKTQVCITPQIPIGFTPNIIHHLVEKSPFNEEKENYLSNLSIRAPPQS